MDFELSEPEKKFRDEVRVWLKANKPRANGSLAEGQKSFIQSRRAWQKKLYDAGYVGITWPEEYGGGGGGVKGEVPFNEGMVPAPGAGPNQGLGAGIGGALGRTPGTARRA